MTGLGDSPLRLEDRPLITGNGAYVADLVDEGTTHCAFVRSPIAHGSFEPPSIEEAMAMPGVLAVLREGEIGLPDLPSAHGPGPPEARGMGQPALARGRVRHVGDPIAVVVAETPAQAIDAADQVWVDIDPLPAVTDVESSLRDEILLFPEAGTNVVLDHTVGSSGPLPEVARRVTLELEIPRLSPVTIEPLAILVRPDDEDGLEIWCGHQAPWRLPRTLGPLLGLSPDKIRARVPDVGGAFGTKGPFYTEYAVVAAAARHIYRPVVWLQTRREQMLSGTHGRGQTIRIEIGGDEDGRIRFVSSDILGDVGAYPATGARVPTFSQLVAQGLYDIEHLQVRARVAVTNKAPTGPYRGAGRPEAAIAIERAVDAFAAELGLTPEVVRVKNLIPSTALPFKTHTGALYDSGDYKGALELALETLDIDHWRAEQRARRKDGSDPIGIGIATFVERAGGAIDSGEWGRVEMLPDGVIEVRTGSTPSGQAHRTVWSQIATAVFSVPLEQVAFIAGDTALVADGVGSFGSRSAQVGGSAIWRTAHEVKSRAIRAAADMLEAAAEDVELADGVFRVVGSPGIELGLPEVAAHASSMGIELWAEEMFTPGAQTFPYGAHAAVVEIELETGHVELLSLVVVDDCGTILNPMVVEGQIHGSVMQGIGSALLESMVYDHTGQLLTANLVTYLIPSATQPMPIQTHRLVSPAPSNPLGAKGTGETGCIGVPGAILNAVHDALGPIGVRSIDFPLTAPRVWQAIQTARG